MKLSIRHRVTRLSASLGLTTLLALGAAIPTFASGETGVTVSGGTLSGGAMTFANFTGVTLNGTQQTTTASWSIADISDARGSGAGWNQSLTLAQLKEYDTTAGSYVLNGKALATSSVKATTAPTITAKDSTSSPTSTITPIALNAGLDTGSAVKLLSAAVDGGMGSYTFGSLGATLTIPANAYAKTYKTDATISLNTGP